MKRNQIEYLLAKFTRKLQQNHLTGEYSAQTGRDELFRVFCAMFMSLGRSFVSVKH